MEQIKSDPVMRESYYISAGDTNALGELSLPLLTARIIDIATAHANSLGIGNPAMQADHKGWVLSRLTIEMESYPEVNTFYTIETWVESWNRHFSERSFRILKQDGSVAGYARSIWMVMDTESHENGGLAHLHLPEGVIIEGMNPIQRQQRHRLLVAADDDSEGQLPRGAIRCNVPVARYTFRYCDLDAYRHVNTVRYVGLLLNQFTLDDFDTTCVRRLELSFLREGHYDETVDIRRHDSWLDQDNDSDLMTSSFLIADSGDGAQILYARIMRRPR